MSSALSLESSRSLGREMAAHVESPIGPIHSNKIIQLQDEHGSNSAPRSLTIQFEQDGSVPLTSTIQSIEPLEALETPDPLLFNVVSLSGRGRGLVARVDITAGTRILRDKPLIITPMITQTSSMEKVITNKLKTLSKVEQRQFVSLHNNFPGKFPFSGIIKTNAILPCLPGPDSFAICPTACLLNHSCIPNAHTDWNRNAGGITIHAICDIKAGEEITTHYCGDEIFVTRQILLQKNFGFHCDCDLCSASLAEIKLSDNRILQIRELDSAIKEPGRAMLQPTRCLADCRQLLQVIENEWGIRAGASITAVYFYAYHISVFRGDEARASVFAQREHRSRVSCQGHDHPETQRVKRLIEQPSNFENSGLTSKKWEATTSMVPPGLDPVAFENWLWRQEV